MIGIILTLASLTLTSLAASSLALTARTGAASPAEAVIGVIHDIGGAAVVRSGTVRSSVGAVYDLRVVVDGAVGRAVGVATTVVVVMLKMIRTVEAVVAAEG
jgi:hypothetical protein